MHGNQLQNITGSDESNVSFRAFSKAEAERRQQQVNEKRSSTSPTGYCFVMNNNSANRYEEGVSHQGDPHQESEC